MKKAAAVVCVLLLAACQNAPANDTPALEDGPELSSVEGTEYGEPLTLDVVTRVSEILDDPEAFLGERVLVEGMIVAVCEMRGCWMDIASDREFEKIQVKVDDGVMVFPLSAKGKQAWVEGTVELVELTLEEAIEQAKHHAEEMGEEFDPATVTGPQTIYRIRGIGAVVAD